MSIKNRFPTSHQQVIDSFFASSAFDWIDISTAAEEEDYLNKFHSLRRGMWGILSVMFPFHQFFSPCEQAYRSLWKEGEPVWTALERISDFLARLDHEIATPVAGVFLRQKAQISIGAGTVVEPGVFIEGPCWIGRNCHIRHGAMLRDGVILGDGCSVGHAAEIKRSVLMEGAAVTHLCYVGDSILGRQVNLGAGVKCANLRLDRKPIAILRGSERIETGLRKLGAILGDGVQIGCNCVLNPGTLVGPQTVSHPLLNLSGYIPPSSQIRTERAWSVEPIPEKILEHLLK